jgi:hypothetical protein
MRVKFGDRIKLCVNVTHSEGSELLIITTSNNEVYVVNMSTNFIAEWYFNDLLKFGYCDVSEYEYSNGQ